MLVREGAWAPSHLLGIRDTRLTASKHFSQLLERGPKLAQLIV
jgi:hypothetical protein